MHNSYIYKDKKITAKSNLIQKNTKTIKAAKAQQQQSYVELSYVNCLKKKPKLNMQSYFLDSNVAFLWEKLSLIFSKVVDIISPSPQIKMNLAWSAIERFLTFETCCIICREIFF